MRRQACRSDLQWWLALIQATEQQTAPAHEPKHKSKASGWVFSKTSLFGCGAVPRRAESISRGVHREPGVPVS